MGTYTMTQKLTLSKVFAGLFLSLTTAFAGLLVGRYVPPALLLILELVNIAMLIIAMFIQRKRDIGLGFVLAFTFISGMTLFRALSVYTSQLGAQMVLEAAGVSAAAFLIAAVVASQTSFDFSFLGGFLLIGLISIVLLGLVSVFIPFSTVTNLIYSVLGIAIFIGYVLFDVNRIAHQGVTDSMVPWVVLSLYLDFINLFLFVLRLMGVLQSSRR